MLRRTELKKRGKGAFYRNWKSCIAICFIYTLLIGGTIISFNKEVDIDYRDNIKSIDINRLKSENNSDIVNEFINGISGSKPKENKFFNKATRGVIGTVSNNVSQSGSYLFGVLNAINQLLFKDRIWASIIIIIGAFLSLFYWIFVSKVVEVGNARYYLENRKYTKTKATKLVLPYRLNKTTHVAYTMFVKNIYNILWGFTIIGGVIKYYSYAMVPYILAENPNLKTKDVINLSKDLMNGYKWELFKLDLSFLGWRILDLITFNISNIIFTTPYINATYAEVYMYLRDLSKTKGIKNAKKLNDINLEGEIVFGEYPIYEYMLRESKKTKILNLNYKRDYGLWDIILLFFIIAFAGWIWEVFLFLFESGTFVNRGALYGPWLPIYGAGGIAMLLILKPLRNNPFIYFLAAMTISGIIEYTTSVYLEIVHHMAWWEYNGYFLNINGRICLEGLVIFGIGGIVVTYIAAPLICSFLDKVNKNVKIFLSVILVLSIGVDYYVSDKIPNSGNNITTEIKDGKIGSYVE